MPQVILDNLQIVNSVALHPFERINVTEAVRATLESRGVLISEEDLQRFEAEKIAEVEKLRVFEPVAPESEVSQEVTQSEGENHETTAYFSDPELLDAPTADESHADESHAA